MATYATIADFEAYMVTWVTEDSAALTKVINQAEIDIDNTLPGAVGETGRKFLLEDLDDVLQAPYLTRAVCAQAEYILHMGPQFFVEQARQVRGPDFIGGRKAQLIAPKALQELTTGGFLALSGRLV